MEDVDHARGVEDLGADARTADESQLVPVEEPENRLSPGSLNALVHRISERCEGKQVLVSTHSSYVLDKLGLDGLMLRHEGNNMRLKDLPADTLDYFKKPETSTGPASGRTCAT
ncbi:MAG TPA: AAA family ATPase [Baekduia sp.]|uniref:AAA family ATPase n=1 Tax=Baekduia sp. TaxID=2600305 RepID=UPI002D783D52|nr:AAA family ATPase [Baekduia sp.]HET6506946.1 AAA family ATPase [Baekduia sp.]